MNLRYESKVAAITFSTAIATFIASYYILGERVRPDSFDFLARDIASTAYAVLAGGLSAILAAFFLRDRNLDNLVHN